MTLQLNKKIKRTGTQKFIVKMLLTLNRGAGDKEQTRVFQQE
jgi:hypothetical protein